MTIILKNGKSYSGQLQTTESGGRYIMTDRGHLVSMRQTESEGVVALWRNNKHFLGYARIDGDTVRVDSTLR